MLIKLMIAACLEFFVYEGDFSNLLFHNVISGGLSDALEALVAKKLGLKGIFKMLSCKLAFAVIVVSLLLKYP